MPAVRDRLRFYCDESVLVLGKALERARDDVVYPGHPLVPSLPTGTLDPEWMPRVAELDLVIVVRRWTDIERALAGRPTGPWFTSLARDRLRELMVTPTASRMASS